MRIKVSTSTGGQLEDSNDPVLVVEFHARAANKNAVYAGMIDATQNNGREIMPGDSYTINCSIPDVGAHRGSVILSKFYAVCGGGDKLDWTAIIRGD